jgi:uncharacterized protein (DUF2147 family)
MKKLFLLLALTLIGTAWLSAQADKVVGFWLTGEGTSQVQIYKGSDGKYYGKISWLEEPNEDGKPKVDSENPDPALKNRPILGLPLLQGFEYDKKDKEWKNGSIYDPDNGKTYDCYMWFEDGDHSTLQIKGFVMGMRFLGRTTAWKRENDRNK